LQRRQFGHVRNENRPAPHDNDTACFYAFFPRRAGAADTLQARKITSSRLNIRTVTANAAAAYTLVEPKMIAM
jgi:hypothetical protein